MSDFTLTRHTRITHEGRTIPVDLVRVGHDVVGYVSEGGGHLFGAVLTDPDADTGKAGTGHTSLGYAFAAGASRESVAQLIVDEWAKQPGLTALAGQSREGWPMVKVGGRTLITCLHCTSFRVSQTIRPGGYGTGPGRSWRMGDPGGTPYAYCHDCGAASDIKRNHA